MGTNQKADTLYERERGISPSEKTDREHYDYLTFDFQPSASLT